MAKIEDDIIDPFKDDTESLTPAATEEKTTAPLEQINDNQKEVIETPKKTAVPQKIEKNITIDENTLKQILEANANLQKQVDTLNKKVAFVSDTNKLRDFDEKEVGAIKTLIFSLSFYVDGDKEYPVKSWKMLKNRVYEDGKKVEQTIELIYLEGKKEIKKEIPLIDMKFLKRVLAPAISMKNSDGTDVYISIEHNAETGLKYHKIHPKEAFFDCEFDIEGQKVVVNTKFLNN